MNVSSYFFYKTDRRVATSGWLLQPAGQNQPFDFFVSAHHLVKAVP